MAQSTILLDACVLINVLASGEAEEILRAAGADCRICMAVKQESLYLRPDDPQEQTSEPVSLDPLIKSGVLSVCEITGEDEEARYVNYASQLDDGEAMSLAIAKSRNYSLATDDRKARRIFLASVGATDRLISTSDLVRWWAEDQSVSPAQLKAVLQKIQRRANFVPPRADSNLKWWANAAA